MYRAGTILWLTDRIFSDLNKGEYIDIKFDGKKACSITGDRVPEDLNELPYYYAMSLRTMQNMMAIIGRDKGIVLRSRNIGVDNMLFRVTRVW